MPTDSESYGKPHTVIVYFDGDELTYDLEHPPSCQQEERYDGHVLAYTCDIAWHEEEAGLFESLAYSGTPVTEPGTYRIQGWSRKTYYHGRGYEHDASMGVIGDEEGESDAA